MIDKREESLLSILSLEELKTVLDTAQQLRDTNQDPDLIASTLLSFERRYRAAEHVVEAAKVYLHSGESGTEHARLLKSIEAFEKSEKQESEGTFGLG